MPCCASCTLGGVAGLGRRAEGAGAAERVAAASPGAASAVVGIALGRQCQWPVQRSLKLCVLQSVWPGTPSKWCTAAALVQHGGTAMWCRCTGLNPLPNACTAGIGLAVVKALANAGANVAMHGLGDHNELKKLQQQIASDAGVQVCSNAIHTSRAWVLHGANCWLPSACMLRRVGRRDGVARCMAAPHLSGQ